MKVLVAGGAGFIGSHTVDLLLAEGFEVVVLDDLRSGSLENISQHVGEKHFRFVRGDVRDSRLVRDLVSDVDAVFHFAALISVQESIKDPALTNDINVNGTLKLLKTCVDFGVEYFVYASSCAVYGKTENLPIKEDCPARPESPYGLSKLVAENHVKAYHENFGLKTVCLRYFNVYGPRQVYCDYSGVITQFLNRLARDLPLIIFGDGEQTRDFVNVHDVVEANILALKRGKIVAGETFNIGTGVATTINQLAKTLLEITNKTNLKVIHAEPGKGDIRHSMADISKAKEKLGYIPSVSLRNGLKELLSS